MKKVNQPEMSAFAARRAAQAARTSDDPVKRGSKPLIERIDSKVWDSIVGMSRLFAPRKSIADVVRISRVTLIKWLETGETILDAHESFDEIPEEPRENWLMAKLAMECRAAREFTGVSLHQSMIDSTKHNHNMLQWVLKTKYRDEFKEPDQSVNVTTTEASPEAAAALVRAAFGEVARPADTDDDGSGSL
jgi:hypothetical protein